MDRRILTLGAAGALVFLAGMPPSAAHAAHAGLATGLAEYQDEEYDEDDEMMAWFMSLSISRDSAGMYADLMGFDEGQADIAKMMYREYLGEYRDAAEAIKGVYEKLEEAMYDFQDEEKMATAERDFGKVMAGFLNRSVELGERYVGDLGALAFDDAQQAGHQRVVHARQRELANGLLGTMSETPPIDLVLLSQAMAEPVALVVHEGAPASSAAEALLQYENELAPTCERIVDLALSTIRKQIDSMSEDDPEAMWEEYARNAESLMRMGEQLEAINERYHQRVASTLDEDSRRAWEKAYKAAQYPQVYERSQFDETYDAAMAIDSLTDDQRDNLKATREHYEREAISANTRWAAAINAAQEVSKGWQTANDEADYEKLYEDYEKAAAETEAASTARSELDQRFADRIRELLTAEQREKLPQEEESIDVDAVLREMGGG